MGNAYRKALFIVTRAEEKFGKILEESIGGVDKGDSRLTASNPFWTQMEYN